MNEQIFYSNWTQELKKGHEDYWWRIGTIAEWIGCLLESKYQTISVAQAKEKFGEVRVYCYLAVSEAVTKRYKKLKKQIKLDNSKHQIWIDTGESTPKMIEHFNNNEYPLEVPSAEEHTEECFFSDLRHYRSVYFQAFRLWPEYKLAIRSGADFREYLFESVKEIDEYFDSILHNELRWYKQSSNYTEIGEQSTINNNKVQREKVKNVCSFLEESGG